MARHFTIGHCLTSMEQGAFTDQDYSQALWIDSERPSTSKATVNVRHLVHVYNIPAFYTVGDLRWYFSTYIENGSFTCFHYQYRYEVQDNKSEAGVIQESRTEDALPPDCQQDDVSMSSNKEAEVAVSTSEKTCCCLVEFASATDLDYFITECHEAAWVDGEGNEIPELRCRVAKVKILQANNTSVDDNAEDGPVVSIQQLDLAKPPLSTELTKENPFPKGNVGTSNRMLLDFAAVGRIDAETVEELGLNHDGLNYDDVILAQLRGDLEYAMVYNIPNRFRSKHLRTHFEDFVEIGGFACFNYLHRPADPRYPQTDKSTCEGVIQLTRKNLECLLENYHDQPWTDEDGEDMSTNCQIRPLNEWEDVTSNKALKKELDCRLFPRGNVGTPFGHLWDLWQQGHISQTVAKRLGLLEGERGIGIDEDVQYKMLPSGAMTKLISSKKERRLQRRAGGKAVVAKEMDTRLGSFEAHTKGIGRKLMEKLGWKEGTGLGKDSSGIEVPVAVHLAATSNRGLSKRGFGASRTSSKLPYGISTFARK